MYIRTAVSPNRIVFNRTIRKREVLAKYYWKNHVMSLRKDERKQRMEKYINMSVGKTFFELKTKDQGS